MKIELLKTTAGASIIAVMVAMVVSSCGGRMGRNGSGYDSDSIKAAQHIADSIAEIPLSMNSMPSVDELDYDITIFDSVHDGKLSSIKNLYESMPGSFTFRGGPLRDADYNGKISGTPSKITKVWSFDTKYDGTKTKMGTWGGGTGWTGQPVYIHWPKDVADKFRATKTAMLTADFDDEEIILGSLCGNVYFLNFKTGKPSREPLDVINPIKGSVSLDPTLNGNLYVGHGIPKVPPMSQLAVNLFKHEISYFSGSDPKAWKGWSANDSSPIRVGQYLFWPSENGTFYKYYIDGNKIVKHSTLRWRAKKNGAAGTENSICIYKNYGWLGNNYGDIICVELNTMKPIWHYDNGDDIDASIVCELEDGVPYIYCGCEVDRQGNTGKSNLVKLNGLTGEVIWHNQFNCNKLNSGGKHFDGGFYATPLLGRGDCKDMLFTIICQYESQSGGDFVAFDKKTGKQVYRFHLKTFAWSSPVGFVNEKGKQYIFAGDSSGNAYLIDGREGKILFCKTMVGNFESSPIMVGNELVVGSRGTEICKLVIE